MVVVMTPADNYSAAHIVVSILTSNWQVYPSCRDKLSNASLTPLLFSYPVNLTPSLNLVPMYINLFFKFFFPFFFSFTLSGYIVGQIITSFHMNCAKCDIRTNLGMVVPKGPDRKSAWRATWKSKMAAILFNMSNLYHLQYSKASESSKNGSGILRNI